MFLGETGGSAVAAHELLALLRGDDGIDLVENAAAALVEQIQQAEGPGAAVAQHDGRDFRAQLLVVRLKRLGRYAMLDHRRAEHARVDDGLARTVRAGRVHDVGRIAEQRDAAVDPCRYRVAIDHRVFEYFVRAAQHCRHIEPVVPPALEVMDK